MKSDSVIPFCGMHLRSVDSEVHISFNHATHLAVADFHTCRMGYFQIFTIFVIVVVGLRHRIFTCKVGNYKDTAIVVSSTNY